MNKIRIPVFRLRIYFDGELSEQHYVFDAHNLGKISTEHRKRNGALPPSIGEIKPPTKWLYKVDSVYLTAQED